MKKMILLILTVIFNTSKVFAIGLSFERSVREYGLGILGWYFLLFIITIIVFIQLIRIAVLLYHKEIKSVVRIIKVNFILISSVLVIAYVYPIANKAIKGDYIIYNQKQLNDLGSKQKEIIRGDLLISGVKDLTPLKKLTEIKGDLIISFEHYDNPHYNLDLKSLDGLNNLKTIGGDLSIKNTSLSNLKGLDNLSNIKGEIEINRNERLKTLIGLEQLKSVNGVSISWNKSLTSLRGLDNLTWLNDLYISSNDLLISLNHLTNLESINKIYINKNSTLESINGLINLKEIIGNLIIVENENLYSIIGLNNITKIGGNLSLRQNANIKSLNGLEKLRVIHGNLSLIQNANIKSLNGLEKLRVVHGNLEIGAYNPLTILKSYRESDFGNKNLSNFCALKNTKVLGEVYIKNNLFNPNFEDISSNCSQEN